MIEIDGPKGEKVEVPSVDTERCIGCGACEYVCPVRPISAIHIVGHEVHKEI
jgi:formate hydrogenlyase subunit 6/NADH:ubiquinone oxidoreductase subunit I